MQKLKLKILDEELAVWKATPERPPSACPREEAGFWSVTSTETEMSVVSGPSMVPEGAEARRGWRCLSVEGPLEFSLTGVLASLAAPLAEAGIPVFVISTFDTDHLLVNEKRLGEAIQVLEKRGHVIMTEK